jgi:hypothetical protein
MMCPGGDAAHVYAAERLNLLWEHLVLAAVVPKASRAPDTKRKDAA